ncbi:MAG: carbon storage regulator CsrA [Planctomycetaceae bacterium]|nr:carbon storage regulator CsrA [Planctomycetaceae bacterium]
MLVLTRKAEEAIIIGESIEVRVLSVQGGRVRLGITCPKEVPVRREEIIERVLDVSSCSVESDAPTHDLIASA